MDKDLIRNIKIHNKIANEYNKLHVEIFNQKEQGRLHKELTKCVEYIKKNCDNTNEKFKAFDYGCGSGNLTNHLLSLDLNVTAADVSSKFLNLVESKYGNSRLSTLFLKNGFLSDVDDNSFDLVATYSVLHHVPDYILACKELIRICKPGGLIFLDHERNDEYWDDNQEYKYFLRKAYKFDFQKYLRPSNYYHKFLSFFNPRHTNEGDIHVWPDDHIEWDLIKNESSKATTILKEDNYLLYSDKYKEEVFKEFEKKISDTKLLILKKNY